MKQTHFQKEERERERERPDIQWLEEGYWFVFPIASISPFLSLFLEEEEAEE